ncbi:MAG: (2Fe-2S) ferredoxin domain-containing protein [Firmicutes bacterium]|nr:(2Fe-2S) ferredoxin domain-containing protein [Bacillota bacterium]
MMKPKKHIFVCTSSRVNGQQKGYCESKHGVEIVGNFMEEIEDRGLRGEVVISNTGCLAMCEQGPIVIVYPDNVWYGAVTADDVEEIMDQHIEEGKIVERLEL